MLSKDYQILSWVLVSMLVMVGCTAWWYVYDKPSTGLNPRSLSLFCFAVLVPVVALQRYKVGRNQGFLICIILCLSGIFAGFIMPKLGIILEYGTPRYKGEGRNPKADRYLNAWAIGTALLASLSFVIRRKSNSA